ncbi:hypothetical protein CGH21_23700 [Vibrio parahaemolyticus]|nr:hypothetical protein CGH66_24040 [Vibrio parahaemolyticus]TOM99426.1 hypothetical protein CGH67_24410 [Vibrio parahaemolyticus]TON10400.1 hypothetical protein CGH64_23500 [Vibrio parahaemolyticus]TON30000.1 hypothetical protein CGH59_23165 [Vibrio parahaemolyticus]TON46766.1 hypothetical protein CGH55_23605 [Vibrio parahaemolyticus]
MSHLTLSFALSPIDHTVNKAFKSDSQRLALSLRSSIAKRRSHLNAALGILNMEYFLDARNYKRCYKFTCFSSRRSGFRNFLVGLIGI